MDNKTKKAVLVIVARYKTWLVMDNTRLKGAIIGGFGTASDCPLCDIYIGGDGCGSCPGVKRKTTCYNQSWFIKLSGMRYFDRRFSFITARKALKNRIEHYEEKLKCEK